MKWMALVLALALLASCSDKLDPFAERPPKPDEEAEDSARDLDLGVDVELQDLDLLLDLPELGDTCVAAVAYNTGLATLLEARCTACHAASLVGTARHAAPLGVDYDSYDDAVANATRGNIRVQAGTMPPGGLAAGERALFAAWLAGGTPLDAPEDACADVTVDLDLTEIELPPEDICASGRTYQAIEDGSPLMNPGQDCIGCHARFGEGPTFVIAGTVFEHFAAPDLCLGPSAVVVEVTDANARVHRLNTNASGNFMLYPPTPAFAKPYTAKVVTATGERAMASAQSNGSCNACHSDSGANGAPGRIVVPR